MIASSSARRRGPAGPVRVREYLQPGSGQDLQPLIDTAARTGDRLPPESLLKNIDRLEPRARRDDGALQQARRLPEVRVQRGFRSHRHDERRIQDPLADRFLGPLREPVPDGSQRFLLAGRERPRNQAPAPVQGSTKEPDRPTRISSRKTQPIAWPRIRLLRRPLGSRRPEVPVGSACPLRLQQ